MEGFAITPLGVFSSANLLAFIAGFYLLALFAGLLMIVGRLFGFIIHWQDTKKCEACCERVKIAATKCRYCGSALAALAAVAFILPLFSDSVRTDPNEFTTVFTDGDQIVTLADNDLMRSHLTAAMNMKEFGRPREKNTANDFFGLGKKSYWVRIRMIDGRLVCEKFALRPKADDERAKLAAALFKEGCS